MLAGDLALIDINPTGSPLYDKTAVVGDKLYFADSDLQHGWELHVLDTTTNTARMVADTNPGLGDSFAGQYGFAVVGTKLYFNAYDPTNGNELRWLDTAEASPTVNTLDINSGSGDSNAGQNGGFTTVGTKLYFTAYDPSNGYEPRWIDTEAATPTVNTLDINSGAGSSDAGKFGGFAAVRSKLYFTASDPTNGNELRWLDTAEASPTVNTLDINSGTGNSNAGQLGGFTTVGSKLFFTAFDSGSGTEPRWIDTAAISPTLNTLDINSGSGSSSAGQYGGFTAVGSKLYFTAFTPTSGYEPRWIDTAATTSTVNTLEVFGGTSGSFAGQYGGFTAVGSKLYFTAADPTRGTDLRWIDTAAAAPTINTLDINPGAFPSYAGQYGGFATVETKIYFTALDSGTGFELRWIDTEAVTPTVNTLDLNSGGASSNAGQYGGFTAAGSKLYFTAADPSNGYDLRWIDTAAAVPTTNTLDIYGSGNSSNAGQYAGFTAVESKLYFTAYDPSNGYEPRWIDTEAATPTVNTLDIYSGVSSSAAGQYGGFTAVGSKLFFTALDPSNGYELRWIDTEAATTTVNTLDINSGSGSSYAGQYGGFTLVGSMLYFTAYDPTSGTELRWIDTASATPTVNTLD
ncbi:MAG: hypothetical protein KDB03_23500, partial [Planctomycetales bacterium]|nr:hypothetical protein [Planctomycetales bacterium]